MPFRQPGNQTKDTRFGAGESDIGQTDGSDGFQRSAGMCRAMRLHLGTQAAYRFADDQPQDFVAVLETVVGRGGIVLFGSRVGFDGAPPSATYAATKGFVQSFAEGIAVEMRQLGGNVLSVAPRPMGTGFAARAGMPMGQAATPETVARSALAPWGIAPLSGRGFWQNFWACHWRCYPDGRVCGS